MTTLLPRPLVTAEQVVDAINLQTAYATRAQRERRLDAGLAEIVLDRLYVELRAVMQPGDELGVLVSGEVLLLRDTR